MPERFPGQDSLKEYLEHLRTVHFTLVVVSAALIVLASKPVPTDIANAHQQIKDIAEVARSWNPLWLHDYAADVVARSNYAKRASKWPQSPEVIEMESRSGRGRLAMEFLEPNWTAIDDLEFPSLEYRDLRIVSGHAGIGQRFETGLELKRPSTLKDFKDLWNYLDGERRVYVPVSLDGNINLFDITSKESRKYSSQKIDLRWMRDFLDGHYVPNGAELELLTLDPQDRQIFAAKTGGTSYCRPALAYAGRLKGKGGVVFGSSIVVWPVEGCAPVPLEGQIPLISRFPMRWRHGRFEDVFEELDSVSTQLQYPEVTLDALERFVAFQERRVGEEAFELLGVKFPAGATATWGVIVVLAVQLYFWLHLAELRRNHSLPLSLAVAWIGVYPSRVPRYVFAISAFLIPVAAVGTLQFHRVKTGMLLTWQTLWAVGSLGLGIWLSVLAWKSRPPLPPQTPGTGEFQGGGATKI